MSLHPPFIPPFSALHPPFIPGAFKPSSPFHPPFNPLAANPPFYPLRCAALLKGPRAGLGRTVKHLTRLWPPKKTIRKSKEG